MSPETPDKQEKSRLRGIITAVVYFAGVFALVVGLSYVLPAESD